MSFGGQNDPTAYTNYTGAKNVQPGTLAYQGVQADKGQNSLDQYLRSLSNYGGQQAQSQIGQGGSMIGTGQGYTAQPASYWSNILSGNPNAMTSAMQPEISAANSQFANAKRQVDTYGPMGGGRSNQMAQLPFQQSSLISNIIAQARPQAAQNLANLGVQQQGLGLQQQGQGASLLNQILAQLYGGRGQDVTETGQNKALGGGLASAAISPFATAGAGKLIG